MRDDAYTGHRNMIKKKACTRTLSTAIMFNVTSIRPNSNKFTEFEMKKF